MPDKFQSPRNPHIYWLEFNGTACWQANKLDVVGLAGINYGHIFTGREVVSSDRFFAPVT
jgi:hypothetical protein